MNAASTSSVRVAAFDGLAVLVQQAGVALDGLLIRLGLDPAVLHEPDNRVAMTVFLRVLDAAAMATGDACIGLHLGASQSLHIAGLMGFALQSSASVRSQLELAARYFALHQDGADVSLQVHGAEATLRYAVVDPVITLHRHDAEATLALCVNHWRMHTGLGQWAPNSVHFEHPSPGAQAEREVVRFFRCPVHFGDTFDGLRFPAAFLDTPLRGADSKLHAILTRYADECLANHADKTTVTGRARRLITAGLANNQARIEDVAARLAITPRTLQRHLADEGIQFAELLDTTRRELAKQYLRDGRVTLIDVAFLVGYSDLSAFHRAFRRWYGITPLAFRRQIQAGGSDASGLNS